MFQVKTAFILTYIGCTALLTQGCLANINKQKKPSISFFAKKIKQKIWDNRSKTFLVTTTVICANSLSGWLFAANWYSSQEPNFQKKIQIGIKVLPLAFPGTFISQFNWFTTVVGLTEKEKNPISRFWKNNIVGPVEESLQAAKLWNAGQTSLMGRDV